MSYARCLAVSSSPLVFGGKALSIRHCTHVLINNRNTYFRRFSSGRPNIGNATQKKKGHHNSILCFTILWIAGTYIHIADATSFLIRVRFAFNNGLPCRYFRYIMLIPTILLRSSYRGCTWNPSY